MNMRINTILRNKYMQSETQNRRIQNESHRTRISYKQEIIVYKMNTC